MKNAAVKPADVRTVSYCSKKEDVETLRSSLGVTHIRQSIRNELRNEWLNSL